MSGSSADNASRALIEIGRVLQRGGYEFVTVTPETHRRVNARADRLGQGLATSLRGVFGWNRPFSGDLLPADLLDLMRAAEALAQEGDLFRSRVRFSSLQGGLFVHSGYPTHQTDAVFFGPDTYRFCRLLGRWVASGRRLVDVGCGTGAGAISIANRVESRVLADISPRALSFARVNAHLNEVNAEVIHSDILDAVSDPVDLVIANPPYMRDDAARLYRDGGGAYGEGLGVRIVSEALSRLSKGGALVLYTGSAFVDGTDTFRRAVSPLLSDRHVRFEYEELDPDVFGDELERPHYAAAERIAAVGLRVTLR
jgi:release factor glutamine methyltransferase